MNNALSKFQSFDLNLDINFKEKNIQNNTRRILVLRIDRFFKKEFQLERNNFFLNYNLDFSKQTSTYFFSLLVYNIKNSYINKYGNVLELTKADEAFYSNKNTKGKDFPPDVYLNFPVNYSVMTTNDVLEDYKKLMNTFYKNELVKKGVSRYSNAFYFYEVVRFLKLNMKNLEII